MIVDERNTLKYYLDRKTDRFFNTDVPSSYPKNYLDVVQRGVGASVAALQEIL